MNSKNEFNRCALPRLEVKFEGAETGKKSRQQLEDEKKELELDRRIRKIGEQRKNMGEDEGNKLGEGDKDEDGGGRKTEEKGKKKLN